MCVCWFIKAPVCFFKLFVDDILRLWNILYVGFVFTYACLRFKSLVRLQRSFIVYFWLVELQITLILQKCHFCHFRYPYICLNLIFSHYSMTIRAEHKSKFTARRRIWWRLNWVKNYTLGRQQQTKNKTEQRKFTVMFFWKNVSF